MHSLPGCRHPWGTRDFPKDTASSWGPSWKKARGGGLGVPPQPQEPWVRLLVTAADALRASRVRPPGLQRRASVQMRPPCQWPRQRRTRAPCVHQEATPSPAHKGGTGGILGPQPPKPRDLNSGCSEVAGPRGPGGHQFREHRGEPPVSPEGGRRAGHGQGGWWEVWEWAGLGQAGAELGPLCKGVAPRHLFPKRPRLKPRQPSY